eukprot:ANDGO_04644.mRNA.1 Adenylate cyclase
MTECNVDFKQVFDHCIAERSVVVRAMEPYTIVAVTDMYLQFSSRAREEVVGRDFFQAFPTPPGSTGSLLKASFDIVKTGKLCHVMEMQRFDEILLEEDHSGDIPVSRERHWVSTNTPVFDQQSGNLTHILHHIDDVTCTVVNGRQESECERLRLHTVALESTIEENTKVMDDALQEHIAQSALLVKLLPKSLVERLRHEKLPLAGNHRNACVMFADMVGFCDLTMKVGDPLKLMDVLHKLFSAFDDACSAHDRRVERIKLIGDCYMAATGIHDFLDDGDDDAASACRRICEAAFDFIPAAAALNINLRIGISCGPVASGIVGTQKPQFDTWGESVNMASRLEGCAVTNTILVTPRVYQYVAGLWQAKALTVNAKGYGAISVYELIPK